MFAEILRHFGLAAAPFDAPPDPAFLSVGPANEEASATLRFIVRDGRNGCLVAAPAGCGKTILARAAAVDRRSLWLDGFAPAEARLCADVVERERRYRGPVLDELHGDGSLVLVDNAADLAPAAWNELFCAFERLEQGGGRAALIVLVESERATAIDQHVLRRLERRCLRRVEFGPLAPGDVAGYIAARLSRAGSVDRTLFSELSIRRIASLSAGVPARINLLCTNALLEAYSDESPRVLVGHVERAAAALRPPSPASNQRHATVSPVEPEPQAPIVKTVAAEGVAEIIHGPIQAIRRRIASLRSPYSTIAAVRRRLVAQDEPPAREHRRSSRVRPAQATAIIETPSNLGERSLEFGFPTSLSREGAAVLAERRLRQGDVCCLWMLDGAGRPIARPARVARTRALGLSSQLFEIGIEFDEPLPERAIAAAGAKQELSVA